MWNTVSIADVYKISYVYLTPVEYNTSDIQINLSLKLSVLKLRLSAT